MFRQTRQVFSPNSKLVSHGKEQLQNISTGMDQSMSLSQLWEIVKDREAWRAAVHGDKESAMTERLNNHLDKMRSWK